MSLSQITLHRRLRSASTTMQSGQNFAFCSHFLLCQLLCMRNGRPCIDCAMMNTPIRPSHSAGWYGPGLFKRHIHWWVKKFQQTFWSFFFLFFFFTFSERIGFEISCKLKSQNIFLEKIGENIMLCKIFSRRHFEACLFAKESICMKSQGLGKVRKISPISRLLKFYPAC